MGAWIEIHVRWVMFRPNVVAPVWGRGLKSEVTTGYHGTLTSPPYGGVD